MEFLILLLLIVLNGVFAMSEIAVVSARKTRLQAMVEEGKTGADAALALAESPNRFLSTVQIGITLINIVAGTFGGATLATQIADALVTLSVPPDVAQGIGVALIIGLTTYLSLVIGELVPKRIGLIDPEGVASFVAGPMNILSKIAAPLVDFLSFSTNLVLRVMPVKQSEAPSVTEGEIITLVREGTVIGTIEELEQEMVEAVFRLDDIHIGGLVTPRSDIVWLDINDTDEMIRHKISNEVYTAYPVCENSVDRVLGLIHAKDLLGRIFRNEPVDDIQAIMRPAEFIPENVAVAEVLERFKRTGVHTAIVISEFGGVNGLVTLHDIMEAIVGDIDDIDHPEGNRDAVKRADGTWLLDGSLPIHRLVEIYPHLNLPEDEVGEYDTLAGFILTRFQRVPKESDAFIWNDVSFEIVDMDELRIDKVLTNQIALADAPEQADDGHTQPNNDNR